MLSGISQDDLPLQRRQAALSLLVRELTHFPFSKTLSSALQNLGGGLDAENARRFALIGSLLASYENTAVVATWASWLLAQHGEEQDKVASALRAGDYTPLQWTVEETLRLYPPVWSLARQTRSEVELGGQSFKSGTWFFVSPWVQGRTSLGGKPLGFSASTLGQRTARRFLSTVWPEWARLPWGKFRPLYPAEIPRHLAHSLEIRPRCLSPRPRTSFRRRATTKKGYLA